MSDDDDDDLEPSAMSVAAIEEVLRWTYEELREADRFSRGSGTP